VHLQAVAVELRLTRCLRERLSGLGLATQPLAGPLPLILADPPDGVVADLHVAQVRELAGGPVERPGRGDGCDQLAGMGRDGDGVDSRPVIPWGLLVPARPAGVVPPRDLDMADGAQQPPGAAAPE